jgi:GAF domain-containing protein/HAMP domain-containing protein
MMTPEQTSPKIDTQEVKRAKNARQVSIVTAVLFALVVVTTFAINIINRTTVTDIVSVSIVGAGAVVAMVSARLSSRGKSDLGILLILAISTVIVISRVFAQKGLAIPTGIVYIILVSSMAIYTLPPKWVGSVITIAFAVAAITIVADQFTVDVPVSAQPQFAIIISLVLGGIYLIILAIQFPSLPLRAKLVVGLVLLTTLPLIGLGWQANDATQDILVEQVKTNILESSLTIVDEFDTFVAAQLSSARNQARQAEVVEYLSLPPQSRPGSEQERLIYEKLVETSKNDVIYIKGYALIDMSGKDLLDTTSSNIGKSYATDRFFTEVVATRKPHVSGLILSPEPGEREVHFAVPVVSESDQPIGVLLIIYNASTVQFLFDQHVRNLQVPAAATEYSYLVDDTNFFIMGHSVRVNLIHKTYLDRTDPRIQQLIEQGAISADSLDSIVLAQPELVSELSKVEASPLAFRAPSQENDNEPAEVAAVRVPNTSWIIVTGQPVSTISTLTQNQTRGTVILSILITIAAAIIALIVSNLFTGPLLQLTKVAEDISAGDFTQRANIRSKDEIGVLAATFNTMSSQIQELVGSLEKRVEQRTAELAHTTEQSEKRAQELQTIAEVSRYVSTEKDLQTLLPLVTRVVSERFGFYHVGIFLLDETGKYAVLRASNSPGGQEMLARQHRLEVGQTGIVGNVTSTGTPRIALDTGADAIYFNNPNLPDTRSEMALPLRARGAIMGALDVQSTVPNAFTDTDISLLTLLADQIAIAIDNARLIDEAQSALTESRAIFSEYVSEAWQRKTASGVVGYHQTLTGGNVITDLSADTYHKNANGHKSLEIPIRVRNQVIGMLNVRSVSSETEWSEDDLNVAQAITERLGLALDNARLFEETSTRASRERLVTEITTKIRGTNNPQEMIKTAVEELKQALGTTRVEIVPRISSPTDK